ncbi:MAG: response regulator transcription factor, partial [Acidobacteriia bacterium]|nr:response regulator transcription factor [Terriglobia bacterium]MBV8903631.1 response regulator transcription factor [Terriglobia bacterium]
EFEVSCVVHEPLLLMETVEQQKPDVVITDINMPGANGIELGRLLIERKLCDAVVILTVYNEPHMIQRAFDSGIRGYVLKVDAGEELAAAVQAVISGYRYLSRGVRAHS